MTGRIETRRRVDASGNWFLVPVYFIDNVEVSRSAFTKQFPEHDDLPSTFVNPRWNKASHAAGVHKTKIGEAVAFAESVGVPTEYTADGRPVFRDRAHRKQFMKRHGMHDCDGGYGD